MIPTIGSHWVPRDIRGTNHEVIYKVVRQSMDHEEPWFELEAVAVRDLAAVSGAKCGDRITVELPWFERRGVEIEVKK